MVVWQALMNGGTCPPTPPTNCSEITLFEVSPAKSLSKGKTTSKCLQVCVGIVYDATVSMITLLLGLGLGLGGAQVDVASLGSTHWNLPFPPVQWLVSVLRDNSTVGAWQVLPEVTGSEGVNRGGVGGLLTAPTVCARMCRGMLWGGTAWLQAIRRLGATGLRRRGELHWERRLTSSNSFSLELKFRGKRWLALKGEPPPGEARVNVCVRSDQIYDPRNYSLWCANTSLNEFLFIFALWREEGGGILFL